MIIIGKSNRSFFSLLTIILLSFLYGCDERDTEVKTQTVKSFKEPTAEEAFALAKNGAETGNGEAQNDLGEMYYIGKGVLKDATQAMEWWQKAAENGNAKAQFNLGEIYYNENPFGDERIDVIVTPDNTKAAEWYRKAAEQGFVEAQAKLGGIYFNGEGVPKNATKTVEWWEKAAAQKHSVSQRNLGRMYGEGLGCLRTPSKQRSGIRKPQSKEM